MLRNRWKIFPFLRSGGCHIHVFTTPLVEDTVAFDLKSVSAILPGHQPLCALWVFGV